MQKDAIFYVCTNALALISLCACFNLSSHSATIDDKDPFIIRLNIEDTTIHRGDSLFILPELVNISKDTITIAFGPPLLDVAIYQGESKIEREERFDRDAIFEIRTIPPGERYSGRRGVREEFVSRLFTFHFNKPGVFQVFGKAGFEVLGEDEPMLLRGPKHDVILSEPIEVRVR